MDMSLVQADLIFVHLSDIHFRSGWTGDAHDEGADLRNELERDLRRLRARLSRLDGLLVSGDIAYGGKQGEYEYAAGWIESIRELLGCDHDGVMITPGNHDIDHDLIPDDGDVASLQEKIREAGSLLAAMEQEEPVSV